MAEVTTAARRLARYHNGDGVISGDIWEVDIYNGLFIKYVGSWAATQFPPDVVKSTGRAYLRVSHGRANAKEMQRFIDDLGQGW